MGFFLREDSVVYCLSVVEEEQPKPWKRPQEPGCLDVPSGKGKKQQDESKASRFDRAYCLLWQREAFEKGKGTAIIVWMNFGRSCALCWR